MLFKVRVANGMRSLGTECFNQLLKGQACEHHQSNCRRVVPSSRARLALSVRHEVNGLSFAKAYVVEMDGVVHCSCRRKVGSVLAVQKEAYNTVIVLA